MLLISIRPDYFEGKSYKIFKESTKRNYDANEYCEKLAYERKNR